jgi:hypothetical protein
MALATAPRLALLPPTGEVVYVDYIEAAPWNLRQPVQNARFLGVGTLLIAAAVHESLAIGLGGRVGLHALPQAEQFYSKRCQMSRYGPDPAYYDLVYFEYSNETGTGRLKEVGLL